MLDQPVYCDDYGRFLGIRCQWIIRLMEDGDTLVSNQNYQKVAIVLNPGKSETVLLQLLEVTNNSTPVLLVVS